MRRRSIVAVGPMLAALILSAPAADAATRYAASPPSATPAAGCTSEAQPCSLAAAELAAAAGDTISIKGGGDPFEFESFGTLKANLDFVGAPGPKPVIRLTSPTGPGFVFGATAAGGKLRNAIVQATSSGAAITTLSGATLADLDVSSGGSCVNIRAPGTTLERSTLGKTGTGVCLSAFTDVADSGIVVRDVTVIAPFASPTVASTANGLSIDRLVVNSGGGVRLLIPLSGAPTVMRRSRITGSPIALEAKGGVLVSDTVLRATALPGGGFSQALGVDGGRFRNVTALASGAGSTGLYVAPSSTAPEPTSVRNSIFRGDDRDVFVPTFTGASSGDLTITHSNFRAADGVLNPASGNNQTGDPLFVNPSAGDVRLREGSPAIDAGTADPDNGTTDLDGRPRTLGAVPDIGAHEFGTLPGPPPPPTVADGAQPGGATGGGSTGGGGGAGGDGGQPLADAADTLAPRLGSVAMTNRVFAVARGRTAVSARAKKKRVKKGTTFRFTSTEAGAATIRIERRTTGRRRGRRCVKQTKRNRKARKCARYVAAGPALKRAAASGKTTVRFTGRIGRKALKPGRYRARLVVTDTARNASKPKTIAFRVVKR